MGTGLGSAGAVLQATGSAVVGAPSPQPSPDGFSGDREMFDGGFDSVLVGVADDLEPLVELQGLIL